MTRIERIAPFLDSLSDEEFDEFLAAASYAAGSETVYSRLTAAEKEKITAAVGRLDAGEGVDFADVKSRIADKLNSAGT